VLALLALAVASGRAGAAPAVCDAAWQRAVDARLMPAAGHGPDLGSAEWFVAVEQQLGLRGRPDGPDAGTPAWCASVQRVLDGTARAPACRVRSAPGSPAGLVCRHAPLALLDLKLAEVVAAARRRAANEHPPTLAAEQRGWQRGRDDCSKAGPDVTQAADLAARAACMHEAYRLRILELQVRYRLVPVSAVARWRCNDGSEVAATFFDATEPPSLVAERGDQTSLMTRQPAASGSRWQGRNESLHERGDEARIVWGWQAPELICTRQP
jgi:uncharacterized protein